MTLHHFTRADSFDVLRHEVRRLREQLTTSEAALDSAVRELRWLQAELADATPLGRDRRLRLVQDGHE